MCFSLLVAGVGYSVDSIGGYWWVYVRFGLVGGWFAFWCCGFAIVGWVLLLWGVVTAWGGCLGWFGGCVTSVLGVLAGGWFWWSIGFCTDCSVYLDLGWIDSC